MRRLFVFLTTLTLMLGPWQPLSAVAFADTLQGQSISAQNSPSIALAKKKKKKKSTPKKVRPACRDRIDNDGDGLVDFPDDQGCKSKMDRRERTKPAQNPRNGDGDGGGGDNTGGGGSDDGGSGGGDNGGGDNSTKRVFPADNAWNQDISNEPVDANSANLIASIGLETGLHPDFGTVWLGAPIGIPYVKVPGSQPKVSVTFDYANQSDVGPYPIPDNPPIEGGTNGTGDRHILMVDVDNWKLYELFLANKVNGRWHAGSGAIWDLNSNATRPAGWTSADAAGLPIYPGLVRYDETVEQGEITHAIRFTVSQSRRAYVHPARHFASSNTSANLPPMGMRVRLKSSFNISTYPKNVQTILKAFKKYGMIVADNGSDWFVSGAPDSRWNDDELRALRNVKGKDFEVVRMGTIVTTAP